MRSTRNSRPEDPVRWWELNELVSVDLGEAFHRYSRAVERAVRSSAERKLTIASERMIIQKLVSACLSARAVAHRLNATSRTSSPCEEKC